jgi:hypothetical protein
LGFRWALSLACLLGGSTLSSALLAQGADPNTRVAARELAMSGAEAYDQEDFVTALDRFQRAEQLYKVPSITVMVARSLAKNGRVVEAVDKYEETLRMPVDASAPEAFQRAVSDAAAELPSTRARVARLELHLPADAPPDAQVLLDERPVPPALLGVPTPVNPGQHRVKARATGKATYELELYVGEGGGRVVDILFASAAPRAPDGAVSGGASKLSSSPWPVVLLTGGGLALVAGTVAGVSALKQKSDLDAECTPGCPAHLRDELSGFRRDRALSYVGLGLGLVSVSAGAYLLFHQSSSGREVGALAYPGGAFVTGRF